MLEKAVLYGVAVYALSYLAVSSSVLNPARKWIIRRSPMFRVDGVHLLECRYCTGFWAALLAISLPIQMICILAFLGVSYFLFAKDES